MADPLHERASELFATACELARFEREQFLERECGQDAELRALVEELLAGDDAPEPLLDAAGENLEDLLAPGPWHPERIGPYRILERIGVGGMGVVYSAEQEHPRRVVAVKVVHPGFVDEALLRRFEHETAMLGWLNHPCIAQVYDAGTVDGANPIPYFAMEYVDGLSLTEYADRNRLSLRDRIELLLLVCDGVRHAHQKGVVHRDLKPANILVTADGQPKILDFGIARAVGSDLQLTTIATRVGEVVGTLSYMSPEQVAADPAQLDTRSDVYSLGVVAYELFCGELPLDSQSGSVPERMRRVLEEEPTRLSTLDPHLAGDVETIVGKALEKDKERRYASVEDFAADLGRFLSHQPIVARAPSTFYQVAKFTRRNRVLVAGLLGIFLALLSGAVVSTRLYLREQTAYESERQAREEAEDNVAALNELQITYRNILSAPNPMHGPSDVRMLDVLDSAVQRAEDAFPDRPVMRARVLAALGQTYLGIGALDDATRLFQECHELCEQHEAPPRLRANAMRHLSNAYQRTGRLPESLVLADSALELYESEGMGDADDLGQCHFDRGNALWRSGRYEEAVAAFERALELLKPGGSPNTEIRSASHNGIAHVRLAQGRPEEGVRFARLALEPLDPENPRNVHLRSQAMNTLGAAERDLGDLLEATRWATSALELMIATAGEEHPYVATLMLNLGDLHIETGDLEEASEVFLELVRIQEETGDGGIELLAEAFASLAEIRLDQADLDEARALSEHAVGVCRDAGDEAALVQSLRAREKLLRRTGDLSLAREALLEARALLARTGSDQVAEVDALLAALDGE